MKSMHEELADAAREFAQDDMRLLCIGPGSARIAEAASRDTQGSRAYLRQKDIKEDRQGAAKIEIVEDPSEAFMKAKIKGLDLIVANCALGEICPEEAIGELFKKMHKMLSRQGALIITDVLGASRSRKSADSRTVASKALEAKFHILRFDSLRSAKDGKFYIFVLKK